MKTFILFISLFTAIYPQPKEVNCNKLAILCYGCGSDTECQECLDSILKENNQVCSAETSDNDLGGSI